MKLVQLSLMSGGGGMLSASVLQCGSERCINDYGFVCSLSVCVYFSIHRSLEGLACAAIVSFFSAQRVYFCLIFSVRNKHNFCVQ